MADMDSGRCGHLHPLLLQGYSLQGKPVCPVCRDSHIRIQEVAKDDAGRVNDRQQEAVVCAHIVNFCLFGEQSDRLTCISRSKSVSLQCHKAERRDALLFC